VSERPTADLLDPAFYVGDPHPAYRWMRRHEPVYRDAKNRLWAITRMEELRAVERDAARFSSSRGYRSVHIPNETSMISQDDPAHAEQRRLVSARFTPHAVARRAAEIRELVVASIERVRGHGAMEVVDALAARIPATLTCRLLGFPDRCWPLLDDWSARLMRVDLTHRDVSVLNDSRQAMIDLGELAAEVLDARRREPRDDLMSVWAHATLGGRPMDFETIWFELGLVVPGGVDTTRTTISRALILLEEHPDLFERMAREPACIRRAVEELLRFITPLNNMFRTALADAEIGGQRIAAGDRLCLLYPSANRDEATFERPDELDFDRDPNPHVAFGLGTHFCLGAHLARLVLCIFFEELTRRLCDLQAVAAPVYEANVFIKGVTRFDLAFRSREGS
jgi:cytochrome P450 family 142 subfamily A polypeptide 1